MVILKESGCHVNSLKSPKTGLSRPPSLLFQMTTPIIHKALSGQQLRTLGFGFTVGKERVQRRGLGPRTEKELMMMMMILTVL